jgi:hypothetical protein
MMPLNKPKIYVPPRKPIFPILFEDSKIPVWLSKIFPINIYAISFAIFIICREKISKRAWRHEMIHYRQQKELYFIGQWILYAYFHIKGYIKYKNGKDAYYKNPFEQEAYANENNYLYLIKRKKYAWKQYKV